MCAGGGGGGRGEGRGGAGEGCVCVCVCEGGYYCSPYFFLQEKSPYFKLIVIGFNDTSTLVEGRKETEETVEEMKERDREERRTE